jgi:S-adenosyl methyltransferase
MQGSRGVVLTTAYARSGQNLNVASIVTPGAAPMGLRDLIKPSIPEPLAHSSSRLGPHCSLRGGRDGLLPTNIHNARMLRHRRATDGWRGSCMMGAGFDSTRPNVARVYDCLLGGFEAFGADREQAVRLLAICPSLGIAALENRYFLARAVTWAAGEGITQFVDLGAGAPVQKARAGVLQEIHVTAQAASPAARVAYVDDDPVVLAHSRAFRAPAHGVTVTAADLTDPDSVLADPRLRAVIDPARPVCLIFGLALSFVPAMLARDVVAGYARRAAPGSCLVISCGRCDDQALWNQLREAYTAASVYNHAPADVEGFLAGLELLPPGLVAAQHWRGGSNDASTLPGSVYVLAGLARKAQGIR